MGQLDEAIRAHLELKRKHGASEEELKAEEQEALGPVRRDSPPVEPASELDTEAADALDEAPTADTLEDGPADALRDEPAADALEEGAAPAAFDEPPLHVSRAYDEPLEEVPAEAFHEPVDPLVEPGFEDAEEAEQETVEYSQDFEPVEPGAPLESGPAPAGADTPPRGFDLVEAAAADDEDDVLEETPDFLQETPEHDRLWFEQKPPRDFDFDE